MFNIVQLLQGNNQYWANLFDSPWKIFINSLDLILVTWLMYLFIKGVAGTKLMTLVQGVFMFALGSMVANSLGLQTVSWLMNQVITYGVIAAVVIFMPEIRTALEKIGRTTKFFSSASAMSEEDEIVQALLAATDYMSPRKIGALISIEMAQTLQEYIATGIRLDANVSSELLINIFIPNTPLHDGAVVISEDKIVAACAYLPLSERSNIPKEFGTRHRAAIGLSEHTDAFTVIVSEETGHISVAYGSLFKNNLTREEFKAELEQVFMSDGKNAEKNAGLWNFWKSGGR